MTLLEVKSVTKEFVTRSFEGVPQDEREKILYGNAAKLYSLN